MRTASTDALHPPLVFGTEFSPATPRPRNGAAVTSATDANLRDHDAPDPSFWTAYDYFMLEREVRAVRRAFILSQLTGWVRKLRGAIRV